MRACALQLLAVGDVELNQCLGHAPVFGFSFAQSGAMPRTPGHRLMIDTGYSLDQRPTIVVVDDDAAVRGSLKFSLEIEGFAVRSYPNAAALMQAEPNPTCSCLVIDQNMPGMSGLRLLADLRQRGVAAPAVLICGHVTAMVRQEAARAQVRLVEKPFLGNVLIDSIRAAMAGLPP